MAQILLENLNSQIKNLEQIMREDSLAGGIRNSKLAKHSQLVAQRFYLQDNLGEAENNCLTALTYIKAGFDEAVSFEDYKLRSEVISLISEEHSKAIRLLILIKLSLNDTISVGTIENMLPSITAAMNNQLMPRKISPKQLVLLVLAGKAREKNIDIVDPEDFSEYIASAIESSSIDVEDVTALNWLRIRAFQGFIKSNRKYAYLDKNLSEKLSKYREISARYLAQVNEVAGAADDLAESYLFEVLALSNPIAIDKAIKLANENITKMVDRFPRKLHYSEILLSKMYIHASNEATDLSRKIKYLSKSIEISTFTQSSSYSDRLKPSLHLLTLVNILSSYSPKVAKRRIGDYRKAQNDSFDLESLSIEEAHTIGLYRSISNFIVDGVYIPTGFVAVDSLYALWVAGVIDSEADLFKYIAKSISINNNIELPDTPEQIEPSADSENIKILEGLLKNDEGIDIEVKLSGNSNLTKIIEVISGLSNTKGGSVIVGLVEKRYFSKQFPDKSIEDYKTIASSFVLVGDDSVDAFRLKLSSSVKDSVRADSIDVTTGLYRSKILKIDNRDILILEVHPVFETRGSLVSYKDSYFMRNDNQTVVMKPIDLVSKFQARGTHKNMTEQITPIKID